MNQPVAIQSWCYRHFKQLPEFLQQLKAAGANATELCGIHADFNNPATAADVAGQFRQAGVQIVAMGVEYLSGDTAKDEPRFKWAKTAGVKNLSISFPPAALMEGVKNIEKLAEQYDLQLGIHNHSGNDWLGNDTILRHVFAHTGPRIGLHIDTAWALASRADPIKWVTEFGPRIKGVHIKDFIFDRKGNPEDVVIGTGNLDLPKFVAALKQINFSGPLVIEYEGDEQNPVPALAECVKKLKALIGSL